MCSSHSKNFPIDLNIIKYHFLLFDSQSNAVSVKKFSINACFRLFTASCTQKSLNIVLKKNKINELIPSRTRLLKDFLFSHFHELYMFCWIKYSLIKRGQPNNLEQNDENFIKFFYQNTKSVTLLAYVCVLNRTDI